MPQKPKSLKRSHPANLAAHKALLGRGKSTARLPVEVFHALADAGALHLLRGSPTVNAFCPTGRGGGVDPTCSPGAKDHARTARELGISPAEMISEAHAMWGAEEEYRSAVTSMLQEARRLFRSEGNGKQLTSRHPAFRNGDPSMIKGFDTVARIMAGRYPEILGAHGYEHDSKDTAEAALFDLLAAGTPRPKPRSHYYAMAIDELHRRKGAQSEVPF